jgi:hypothetical protein
MDGWRFLREPAACAALIGWQFPEATTRQRLTDAAPPFCHWTRYINPSIGQPGSMGTGIVRVTETFPSVSLPLD